MKTSTKLILFLLLLAMPVFGQDATRDFLKTLEVSPGTSFSLDHSFGDIEIFGWDQNKIEIKATIRVEARRESTAKEILDAIVINVNQSAQTVKVSTDYPEKGWKNVSYSVDYEIHIPANSPVSSESSFGNMTLTGLTGKLSATLKHGDLRVEDCLGQSDLKNQFGQITVRGLGGSSKISNMNGDIEVETVNGSLQAEGRFGNISVMNVDGDLTLDGSNGDLDVKTVKGKATISNSFGGTDVTGVAGKLTMDCRNGDISIKSVTDVAVSSAFGGIDLSDSYARESGISINNQNGDVSVRKVKGNVTIRNTFASVEAQTIDGNLEIRNQNSSVLAENISGDITVSNSFGPVELAKNSGSVKIQNQNGSVEISQIKEMKGDYDISTSFGEVTIELPEKPSVNLSAATTFGNIESDFDLTITDKFNKSTASGTLGDGKQNVSIRTQNAGIEIRKVGKK